MANQNTQENVEPKKKSDQALNTDDTDTGGAVYSKNLMKSDAEKEVRENEDASLQDDSYAFDSDNTGNEDIHDVADFDSDGEADVQ